MWLKGVYEDDKSSNANGSLNPFLKGHMWGMQLSTAYFCKSFQIRAASDEFSSLYMYSKWEYYDAFYGQLDFVWKSLY